MQAGGMGDEQARRAMDDKGLAILLGIKDDVGEIRGTVGRLEGQMASLPCGLHSSAIRNLETKIDAVDARVAEIREKDLPEIRQRLAVLDWWRSNRNKLIAAILVALLGVAGAVAGDLAKDALKSTPAGSVVPAAQAAPVGQPDAGPADPSPFTTP